jgi:hypothetical protein
LLSATAAAVDVFTFVCSDATHFCGFLAGRDLQ